MMRAGEIMEQYVIFELTLFSKSIYDPIGKAEIARWHTGCYKNDEDDCFYNDTTDQTGQNSPLTEPSHGGFQTQPMKKLGASLLILIGYKLSSPEREEVVDKCCQQESWLKYPP